MGKTLRVVAAVVTALVVLAGMLFFIRTGRAPAGRSTEQVLAEYKARDKVCPATGLGSNLEMLKKDDGVHVPFEGKDVFVLPVYPGAQLITSRACEPVPWSALADATWTTSASVTTVKAWYVTRQASQEPPPKGDGSLLDANSAAVPEGDVHITAGPSANHCAVHVERPQSDGPTVVTVYEQYGCTSC